jgi:hypothetical protein
MKQNHRNFAQMLPPLLILSAILLSGEDGPVAWVAIGISLLSIGWNVWLWLNGRRPIAEIAFGVYPTQNELAKTNTRNLLRHGILVQNGQREREVFTYWVENEHHECLYRFVANRHILPKRLAPNERYVFEYLTGIHLSTDNPTPRVRPCIQLDGPKGKVIRGRYTLLYELPKSN